MEIINHRRIMYTPKQLSCLSEISERFFPSHPLPTFGEVSKAYLLQERLFLTPYLEFNRNGCLECIPSNAEKGHIRHKINGDILMLCALAARANLPIGEKTKGWMGKLLRNSQLAKEVELMLSTFDGSAYKCHVPFGQ